MLPAIKMHKLKQSTQVFEESPSGGGLTSDCAASIVQAFPRGMGEEGQPVERGQQVGQMPLDMGKVMAEMITVVLEGIVIFILDFPSSPACGDSLHDIVFINGVRCGPGIAIDEFLFCVGDGNFTPVHQQGIVAVA